MLLPHSNYINRNSNIYKSSYEISNNLKKISGILPIEYNNLNDNLNIIWQKNAENMDYSIKDFKLDLYEWMNKAAAISETLDDNIHKQIKNFQYNLFEQLNTENQMNEKLIALANWLESPENDFLKDCNDEQLEVVATTLVNAADAIREGAEIITPEVSSSITEDSLTEMAAIAEAFDASGDELLQKQASVLDEILMTISADKNAIFNFKQAEDKRLDELKKKYEDVKKQLDDMGKTADSLKAIEKSDVMKEYKTLEAPLNSRYCPDHPGAQMQRIGEHEFQCSLDGKAYNYEAGYKLLDGSKVPGGDVSGQSQLQSRMTGHQVFDTRSDKLGLDQ